MYILLTWQHVPSGQLYFWDLQCLISQIYIWIVLIFRGLLVQMAGQCAAASSCCQFPNFPDLRVRPSPRQPETGAVGCGWKLPTCANGKLLHSCHSAGCCCFAIYLAFLYCPSLSVPWKTQQICSGPLTSTCGIFPAWFPGVHILPLLLFFNPSKLPDVLETTLGAMQSIQRWLQHRFVSNPFSFYRTQDWPVVTNSDHQVLQDSSFRTICFRPVCIFTYIQYIYQFKSHSVTYTVFGLQAFAVPDPQIYGKGLTWVVWAPPGQKLAKYKFSYRTHIPLGKF